VFIYSFKLGTEKVFVDILSCQYRTAWFLEIDRVSIRTLLFIYGQHSIMDCAASCLSVLSSYGVGFKIQLLLAPLLVSEVAAGYRMSQGGKMNENIQALVKACELENVSYEVHHKAGNFVSVDIGGKSHFFMNWTTPFNSQVEMQLCKDKDYFYSFFKDSVLMPRTSSFLNPYSKEKYEKYRVNETFADILEAIEQNHSYPMIIKRNKGTLGHNVFKVSTRKELEKGIVDVFNKQDAAFDYVCIAQDYIDILHEYRVIFFEGEYQFSYRKVIDDACFNGNISPLHWDGARAELTLDTDEEQRLAEFCLPLFEKATIPFCGLDVAVDTSGKFWLIEANSAPGFAYIIEHGGEEAVIALYRKMLTALRSDDSGLPVAKLGFAESTRPAEISML